jgi:glucose/arabinose dehydrogenase
MKKKLKISLFIFLFLILIAFVSLWNLVSDGYDKQNQVILNLKKIIPRSLALKVRDTLFIIPELKTKNKLLKLQVDKYEQGLDGQLFAQNKVYSKNKKEFVLKEFFLPFKQLDIKAGWNKLSNTFRAHYLEIIEDKVIVLSGEGKIIYFDIKNIKKDKLEQKEIKTNIKRLALENNFEFFGVRDILYDQNKIYISMIIKNSKGFTMNIYEADYNLENLKFNIFFEKKEFTKTYTIQSGGRLEKYKDNKILFSLGTAESLKDKAQDINYLEGKIISIDKSTKDFDILSVGHRNPQGLYFVKNSQLIINSEHGPKGGDEINLNFINSNQDISNFGWPISSYGIEYDGTDPYKKSHEKFGFIEPFKNFSESIGISEIIYLKNDNFLNGNNLIISSLRASSIYLLSIDENFSQILNEDRIFFSNQRIRDIEYDENLNLIFIMFEVTPSIGVLSLN